MVALEAITFHLPSLATTPEPALKRPAEKTRTKTGVEIDFYIFSRRGNTCFSNRCLVNMFLNRYNYFKNYCK
ncbi:hypothetical protein ERO13_D11G225750v2 [Gossypium hirsutum]|nr:hypothetical protein ERO13_D11G225750v2 [Gossypium hirsutum]